MTTPTTQAQPADNVRECPDVQKPGAEPAPPRPKREVIHFVSEAEAKLPFRVEVRTEGSKSYRAVPGTFAAFGLALQSARSEQASHAGVRVVDALGRNVKQVHGGRPVVVRSPRSRKDRRSS